MPLQRVFKIFFVCFLAAFALGCGSGSDDNFTNFQSFQNFDAPVRLRFQNVPARAAGTPFAAINVAVLDHNGKVVTTDDREVRLRLTEPNGANILGDTSVNAVNGVATFTGISVDQPGTYTFTAEADGLISAESAQFTITGGAAAQISFLQGPPAAPASLADLGPTNSIAKGVAITPAVRVQVLDEFGNPAPDGTSVTIIAGVDPTGTTTLSGNRVTTVNGVATFDNLVVETGGGATVFVAAVSGSVIAIADPSFVLADTFVYATLTLPMSSPVLLRANIFSTMTMPPGPPAMLTPAPVGGAFAGMGEIANATNPPGTFTALSGLVNHPTGSLYGVSNLTMGGAPVLLELNPLATGMNANLISSTPITGVNAGTLMGGLTVDPSTGIVYLFVENGTSPGLYTLNIDSAVATFIGAPGAGFTVGNGIAWDPFANNGDGAIFTGGGNGTTNGLSFLDATTGAATEIAGTSANLTAAVLDLVVNPLDTSLVALLTGGPATTANQISKTTGEDVSQTPLPANLPFVTAIAPYIEEPVGP